MQRHKNLGVGLLGLVLVWCALVSHSPRSEEGGSLREAMSTCSKIFTAYLPGWRIDKGDREYGGLRQGIQWLERCKYSKSVPKMNRPSVPYRNRCPCKALFSKANGKDKREVHIAQTYNLILLPGPIFYLNYFFQGRKIGREPKQMMEVWHAVLVASGLMSGQV